MYFFQFWWNGKTINCGFRCQWALNAYLMIDRPEIRQFGQRDELSKCMSLRSLSIDTKIDARAHKSSKLGQLVVSRTLGRTGLFVRANLFKRFA